MTFHVSRDDRFPNSVRLTYTQGEMTFTVIESASYLRQFHAQLGAVIGDAQEPSRDTGREIADEAERETDR